MPRNRGVRKPIVEDRICAEGKKINYLSPRSCSPSCRVDAATNLIDFPSLGLRWELGPSCRQNKGKNSVFKIRALVPRESSAAAHTAKHRFRLDSAIPRAMANKASPAI